MPGVEILYAEEITSFVWNGFVWSWGPAIAVFLGLVLIGLAIYFAWQGFNEGEGFIAFTGVIVLVCGCIAVYFNGTIPVYDHTEYKIIVDENADMNKFFEKYELIDIEGKIYNVKNEERLIEGE